MILHCVNVTKKEQQTGTGVIWIFCNEEDVSTVTSFGFLSFSVCDCNQSIQLECNHIHHSQAAD